MTKNTLTTEFAAAAGKVERRLPEISQLPPLPTKACTVLSQEAPKKNIQEYFARMVE